VRVLVVNAGSSSLKLAVLDGETGLGEALVERWDGSPDTGPLADLVATAGGVDAVGHRVVHGGARHLGPAVVDAALVDELTALTDLAPLHQPRALAGIRAASELLPDLPAVACFDTAFHRRMPAEASTYAVPAPWTERWGLRRYGFHGLSHAYACRRAAGLLGRPLAELRVVSCHLGAGASLCAVRDGVSVDTTMGFTPLEGLVMATRSGTVDPGMLLWLLDQGLTPAELSEGLEHRSGLAGLSGTSGDLRDVLRAREDGSARAALAYDVLVHRLCREVAGMVAAAGGLDLLVLTGGMGEHSVELRRDLAERLAFLGVAVDPTANAAASGDADVSADGADVRTVVVTAREDLQIAREVVAALSAPAG
jgi:acetate kinase